MIAAIYVRKSTGQNGVADDQKSIARQIKHAADLRFREGLGGRRGLGVCRRRDLRPGSPRSAVASRCVSGAERSLSIVQRRRPPAESRRVPLDRER